MGKNRISSGGGSYFTEPTHRIISRYLDTAGDGSGAKEATGDYSITPEEFYLQPPVNEVYQISRLLVSIEDTTGMVPEEYGNLGSALANGVSVSYEKDGVEVVDLTDGLPIKNNAQWGMLCFDVDVKNWANTPTDELVVVRWTFARSGTNLRLSGFNATRDRLVVSLNDNLEGLISHRFKAQGFIETQMD